MFDGMFDHCRLFGIGIDKLQYDLVFTKLELQPWNACLHYGLHFYQTKKI